MNKTMRTLAMLSLTAVVIRAQPVIGATDPVLKASVNCRNTIAAQISKLIASGLKITDTCHVARNKGKFSGDCNRITTADLKGKYATAEARATTAIDKKCGSSDPVHDNYASGIEGTLFPAVRTAVESSSGDLLGALDLQGDKAKLKCHKSLGANRTKIVREILKLSTKCQKVLDRSATQVTQLAELMAACLGTPVKSGPKGHDAIVKACGALGGADVGSCGPTFPDCLVTSATATGQTLGNDLYGQPPVCGNHVIEGNEACDDGNVVDGDGCDSNCTVTGCGNAIVTAGEQCDDGNALTTDACVNCQPATCGDGFVHAGVELCGDAPSDACQSPGPATCQVTQCGPPTGTRAVIVSFTKPADKTVGTMTISLDYPEEDVRIPGTGEDDSVKSRVTVVPSGLQTRDDRNYELRVSILASAAIDAGPFFTVQFDDCAASTIDEYACKVESAFDESGIEDVTALVNCTVGLQ